MCILLFFDVLLSQQLRRSDERLEEESARHKRDIQTEEGKYKIIQQKLYELEVQLKNKDAAHEQSREKSKEVLRIATQEGTAQADMLRQELQQCSEKLSAAIDKNAASEQQVSKS